MRKDRKCKNCGQMFEPKEPGEMYCSSLCRATGKFIGGGGDTSKPMSSEQRKAMERKQGNKTGTVASIEKGAKAALKYPHVVRMFDLPMHKRWEVAQKFTPEEAAYARRIMKRKLMEEKKIAMCCEWCGEEGEMDGHWGEDGCSIGDSDDGTI